MKRSVWQTGVLKRLLFLRRQAWEQASNYSSSYVNTIFHFSKFAWLLATSFFPFSQGMVRIYDIPDNTFESSDEDEDEEEEEEEDEKGELFCLHRELLSLYLC